MLATGTVLQGRYHIVSVLGKGGFATVYLADDSRLTGRQVAIKAFNPSSLPQADQTWGNDSFKKEADLLARLNHPDIANVSDFFSAGGFEYLVMDYISGETLAQALRRRGQGFEEVRVLSWAQQLCTVLQYLHNHDLIFRDLKPSNIILQPDGQLKLIDFGIVRYFKPGQTSDTQLVGTAGYAPPEQYGTGQTDARSDIYSLGVVLHQLLTNHNPTSTPMNLPPLETLNSSVSPHVLAAINKALKLEPSERFASMSDFAEALRAPASGQSSVVGSEDTTVNLRGNQPATTSPTVIGKPSSAFPWLLLLGGVVVVGLLFFLFGARESIFGEPEAEAEATAATETEVVVVATSTVEPTEATLEASATPSDVPTSEPMTPLPEQELPTVTVPASPSETPITPATSVPAAPSETPIAPPTSVPAPTLTATTENPSPPSSSPWQQGKIAFVQLEGDHNRIYVIETTAGQNSRLLPEPAGATSNAAPSWSPDGTTLAFDSTIDGANRVMSMADAPGSVPEPLNTNPQAAFASSPTWAPDGQQVISYGAIEEDTYFFLLNILSSDEQLLSPGLTTAQQPAWSPLDNLIAFAAEKSGEWDIYTMPIAGGAPINLTRNAADEYAPAWSPDGNWIAYQTDFARQPGQHEIWLMDPQGVNAKQVANTPRDNWSRSPTWSPDGQWIAFVSNQAGSIGDGYGELFVISVESGETIQITTSGGQIHDWRPSWGR